MFAFWRPKISADDLRRLDRLDEQVESLTRRFTSLVEDVDEYFRKVNKARQRVNAEDRRKDEAQAPVGDLTRAARKDELRRTMRLRGA